MTTALLSLFAACTNDDFISNGQGTQSGDAAMRPAVDVTLNVLGDGADTRFGFTKEEGYKWETGDKIGALLMDEVRGSVGHDENNQTPQRPFENLEEWAQKPWTERYRLVDYVGTDYPFERQEDGTWTTNSKMLEGNYFFTAPFADYMGNREAVHSIGEQKQDGRDWEGAYADNQFFIGYSRIMAGTQGEDVMSANLEMTPVLGAVGLTIENQANIATTFTVEKVVLECDDFSTLIKINPVAAKYTGENENLPVEGSRYNIDKNEVEWWSDPKGKKEKLGYFNYANYEEVKKGEGVDEKWKETIWVADEFNEEYVSGVYVNNTGRSTNYKRQNALRAVVNNVEESGHRAAVTIENSPELKVGESIQVVVMTNIWKAEINPSNETVENPVKAWIYTNKGLVGPINLNEKQTEQSGVSFGTDARLQDEIRPGQRNSVHLILDITAIESGAAELDVYTSEDLEQLIDWNQYAKNTYKADLKGNVTLTPAMSAKLMKSESNLYVKTGKDYTLTLAEGVDKSILDKVLVDGNIKVENALELGSKSYVNGNWKPAYGAAWSNAATFYIENTINIAEGGSVDIVETLSVVNTGDNRRNGVTFGYNKGTLTIKKDVTKFSIAKNEGKLNINAQVGLSATSNNVAGGYVTVAAGAELGGVRSDYKFVNEGKQRGELLGDLRYNEENVDAAIIDNYGRISNLENKEFGKLIMREGAGDVTLTANSGIVDITEDIEASVTKTYGNIVYAVTGENTAKEIADAQITALLMDGGTITTTEAATLDKVAKLHSTNNGGVIGNDDAAIAFPKAAEIELNGNLTLNNVDLSGTATDVLIKSGTTTIEGTVNLVKTTNNTSDTSKTTWDKTGTRRIILASYNYNLYEPVDAELHIATDAVLKARNIRIAEEVEKLLDNQNLMNQTYAIVDNDSEVQLIFKAETLSLVSWRGYEPVSYEYPKPTAGKTVALESSETLADLMDKYENPEDIEVIEISKELSFAEAENNSDAVIAFLKDKEIVLKANGKLTNVSGNLGLAIKKLTVVGSDSSVGSGTSAGKALMLTVDEIELKDNATLTIWHSSIMLTKVQTMGKGYAPEGITKGANAEIEHGSGDDGKINAKDAQGNLLTLDLDNFVWE